MITNVNSPNGHNRKTQLFTAIAAPISNEESKPSDSSLSGAESGAKPLEGKPCGFVTMPEKVDPAKIVQDVRYANTEKYKRQREKAFRLSEQQAMYLKMFGAAFAILTVTQAFGEPALHTATANNQRYGPAHQGPSHASTSVTTGATAINPVQNLLGSTFIGATPLKPYSPEYAALDTTHLDGNQFGMTNKVSRKHNRSARTVRANSERKFRAKSALERKANSAGSVKSRSRRSVDADHTPISETANRTEALVQNTDPNSMDVGVLRNNLEIRPKLCTYEAELPPELVQSDAMVKRLKEPLNCDDHKRLSCLVDEFKRSKALKYQTDLEQCNEKRDAVHKWSRACSAAGRLIKEVAEGRAEESTRACSLQQEAEYRKMNLWQDAASRQMIECQSLRENVPEDAQAIDATSECAITLPRANYTKEATRKFEFSPPESGCFTPEELLAMEDAYKAKDVVEEWEDKHLFATEFNRIVDQVHLLKLNKGVHDVARDAFLRDIGELEQHKLEYIRNPGSQKPRADRFIFNVQDRPQDPVTFEEIMNDVRVQMVNRMIDEKIEASEEARNVGVSADTQRRWTERQMKRLHPTFEQYETNSNTSNANNIENNSNE